MVIGSSGDVFSSSTGSFQWSLGEVIVETYHGSDGFFTQGFEQSYSASDGSKNAQIYPNPVPDVLYLKTYESGDYAIECFTIHGVKIAEKIIRSTTNPQVHPVIDMVNFGQALYILKVRNLTTGKQLTTKVAKL